MSNMTMAEPKKAKATNSQKVKRFESWHDRVGDGWLANAPTVLNEETPVRMQYIKQVLKAGVQGLQVLDLGAGGMATIAENLAAQGAHVTVVDQNSRTLELAAAHAKKAGLNINFNKAQFNNLPFPDAAFDVVYAFDLLEHAGPQLHNWFSEINRVLKPGGKFIYNMPNRTVTSRMMIIFIFERVIKLNPPGHHNFAWFMQPQEMREALAKADLWHQHQIGFMNLQPKPIAGINVLTRQGAPGGFKLGKDDSLVYVGYASKAG